MKDVLKESLLLVALLALFIGIRFAVFMPLHYETISVMDVVPSASVKVD